jgi:hypothetical protein
MKRLVLASILVSLFAIVAIANAQGPGWWGGGMMGGGQGGYGMGPGMMWGGQGGNYCPNCGQYLGPRGGYGGYGMGGPGMMGGYGGYGMGPGMMGGYGGYGMGPGMMGGYGGYGTGPGYGHGEECQKFLDETAGMRKELYDKRFEYSEALRSPKTTTETAAKLEKDIRELQDNIYKKAPQGCW